MKDNKCSNCMFKYCCEFIMDNFFNDCEGYTRGIK
jgi:hypothetical protein